jgi:hypothetical protein
MDNVQNHDSYINIPPSQIHESYLHKKNANNNLKDFPVFVTTR